MIKLYNYKVKKGLCGLCWEQKEPYQHQFCKACAYLVRRQKQRLSKKKAYASKKRGLEMLESAKAYYYRNRQQVLEKASIRWHKDVEESRLKKRQADRLRAIKLWKLTTNQEKQSLPEQF